MYRALQSDKKLFFKDITEKVHAKPIRLALQEELRVSTKAMTRQTQEGRERYNWRPRKRNES